MKSVRGHGFQKLLQVHEALELFKHHFPGFKPEIEVVSVWEGYGRVLGEDVKSKVNVPPFPRAAMDGYAVRAVDTYGISETNPKYFRVIGQIEIGQEREFVLQEDEAVQVSTGSPVPSNADAVVMHEVTERVANEIVEIKASVFPSKNLSATGEDLRKGDVILEKGRVLMPADLALLKSAGHEMVKVIRRPRIGVMATGDELVEGINDLEPAKIIESNRVMLKAFLERDGAIFKDYGIVSDDEKKLKDSLSQALEECDAVIVTGGTSVGTKDLIPEIVHNFGEPGVFIHGIAIGPGRPVAVAKVQEKMVLLLPGYPVAALLNYEIFIPSFLSSWYGYSHRIKPGEKIKARLRSRVSSKLGVREFARVILEEENGVLYAKVTRRRGAGVLSSITRAHGILVIPEESEGFEEDTQVEIIMLRHY